MIVSVIPWPQHHRNQAEHQPSTILWWNIIKLILQILFSPEETTTTANAPPTSTAPTPTESTTRIHTTGKETSKRRTHFNWEEEAHLVMKWQRLGNQEKHQTSSKGTTHTKQYTSQDTIWIKQHILCEKGIQWSAHLHHTMPHPQEHVRPRSFLKYDAMYRFCFPVCALCFTL